MRRRRIQIKIILLHVFAVIALISRQPEQTLFQNGIAPIPQRQREADALVPVAYPAESVFTPAIGARTRMFVRKIFPRGPIRAVILADRDRKSTRLNSSHLGISYA